MLVDIDVKWMIFIFCFCFLTYLTCNAFPQLLFSHVYGSFMIPLAEAVVRGFMVKRYYLYGG